MTDLKAHAKLLQQFLDKSDGRDKLLAAVQYAAMFVAAGQAGDVKKVQASVATARKVFRIMRPLEVLNPLLQSPGLDPRQPLWVALLYKLRPLMMSLYFGADHVVWAQQAGLLNNKALTDRAQKASLYGWACGSLCTLLIEFHELTTMAARRAGESEDEYYDRLDKARPEVNRRLLTLVHALTQAALAAGLLELRPWKPRTVGAIGVVTSLINCYMLYPSVPGSWSALFGSRSKPRVPALKTA